MPQQNQTDVTMEKIDAAIAEAEQVKKDAAKKVRKLKRLRESAEELAEITA